MRVSKKRIRGKFRRTVTTETRLVYYSDLLGLKVTIEPEYQSDGASVPQAFWNRYPPFGEYLESAIVHDYFCDLGNAGDSPISSKDAARIFREAMQVQGVSKWKRNVMYQAVRWLGPRFDARS